MQKGAPGRQEQVVEEEGVVLSREVQWRVEEEVEEETGISGQESWQWKEVPGSSWGTSVWVWSLIV